MRLQRYLIILWLIVMGITTPAQDFEQTYTFIDGTTFDYPANFSSYNETIEEYFIRNSTIDMYFFTLYEQTQATNSISTLPEAIDWYFGEFDVNEVTFDVGDERVVNIFGREAARYELTVERDDGSTYQRIVIALEIGDNGSIAIVSTIPIRTELVNDEELMLQIISTLRAEDFADLGDSLGDTIEIDDDYILQYPPDEYTLTLDGDTPLLERDGSVIIVDIKLEDDLAEDGIKNYPVDLLWYIHSLKNAQTPFEANDILFQTISTNEIVRYRLVTQDEQNLEIWVTRRNDEAMAVIDVINPQAIDEADVLRLVQTIRPEDAAPPYSLLPMGNTYRLPENINISYPMNWRPDDDDTEDTFVDLVSIDTRIFLFPFNETDSENRDYTDNLADALLSIVEPLDENVIIRRSDVTEITLPSGLPAASAVYTETNEGFSYERMVVVVGLPDGSVVFAGVVPRFDETQLSDDARSRALAILGTMTSN